MVNETYAVSVYSKSTYSTEYDYFFSQYRVYQVLIYRSSGLPEYIIATHLAFSLDFLTDISRDIYLLRRRALLIRWRRGDRKQKTAPRAQTIATRMSSASQRNAQPLPSVAKEYIIKHARRNRRGQARCMCCSPCYTAHTRRRQDVSQYVSIALDRRCRRCRNALRTANTS